MFYGMHTEKIKNKKAHFPFELSKDKKYYWIIAKEKETYISIADEAIAYGEYKEIEILKTFPLILKDGICEIPDEVLSLLGTTDIVFTGMSVYIEVIPEEKYNKEIDLTVSELEKLLGEDNEQ